MAVLSPLTPTLQEACGDCYEDVTELIRITVAGFVKRYGGDFDDLLADAQTAYVKGFIAFHEGRNNSPHFDLEIRRWVWFELFDDYRTRAQVRNKVRVKFHQDENMERRQAPARPFNFVDFLDSLSSDAQVVAMLVLDTPENINKIARAKGGTDNNLRSTIRQHLATHCRWSARRIAESFDEIKRAL